MKLHMACACHMGKVRSNNEDNFYFAGRTLPEDNTALKRPRCHTAQSGIWPETVAVFDGMGGEACGEMAAFAAARALRDLLQTAPDSDLGQAVQVMNQAVCDQAKERRVGGTGCTMVLARFWGEAVELVNVGDSRGFLFRDGWLEQLSRDHTDEKLLKKLNITSRKPRLTQYLGSDAEEIPLEPYRVRRELEPGDVLVLCSDGLTDMVSPQDLADRLGLGGSAKKLARDLLDMALANGGVDNTTIIVTVVGR